MPTAEDWYQLSVSQVLKKLNSNSATGLSEAEASRRLTDNGPNELEEQAGRSHLEIIREQLTGLLTIILILAALISFWLGDEIEAIVILAIVVLNALLGYSQEAKAEQAMAALKRMAVPIVRVRRDGQINEISARLLVPGDVVVLETGNIVPADGRVVQSVNMRVTEATLTGESEAVDKTAGLVFEAEMPLGDRRNMAYSGTIVSYGHGEMVVTATGMQTELGKIADLLQSVEEEATPLQLRLDKLGRMLAGAALVLVIVIFSLGVLGGQPIEEMFLTAVSLAVAAIPEALTAVVTIALSLGAQRMLKQQALIRKLPAVETLGSVSIICSDKTGTLTQNRMTVTVLDIANQRLDLTQRPHATRLMLESTDEMEPAQRFGLDILLLGGALCNDSVLARNEDDDGFHAVGDPTEGALVLAAAQVGIIKDVLDSTVPRVAELPFDSERKRMTTIHRMPQSQEDIPASLQPIWQHRLTESAPPPYVAFTKGAVDGLLEISSQVWVEGELQPFDDSWQQRVMQDHDDMAAQGMRVLGVGLRPFDHAPDQTEVAEVEHALILVGLFGMIDPARPEVKAAVATCRSAGIRPVMITGDHPLTARHIAQDIGISDNGHFLTGQELDHLTEAELLEQVKGVSVFARVSPEHKLKLVDAFQQHGHLVAMTGDGVNDAPALQKADIGIAMGITGTDVSKEAAEMVLLDDNFATIVAAVEEGRVIYDNIRRFIKYLLSCNTSEIAVMLIAPFFGMPLPLLPLQILWMNLVTDGLPALALGIEPAEADVMKRRPYSSEESIFGHGMVSFIIGMGIVMSIVALGIGLGAYFSNDAAWQTLLFTTLIFCQLALALEARSENTSLWQHGLLTNPAMLGAIVLTIVLQLLVIYVPFFQTIFSTSPLTPADLLISFTAALAIIIVAETWKAVRRSRGAGQGGQDEG